MFLGPPRVFTSNTISIYATAFTHQSRVKPWQTNWQTGTAVAIDCIRHSLIIWKTAITRLTRYMLTIWLTRLFLVILICALMTFFALRSIKTTRGHPYKLFKIQCTSTTRSSLCTERVVNIWNYLPSDTVDISSLTAFKCTNKCVDFSNFLNF